MAGGSRSPDDEYHDWLVGVAAGRDKFIQLCDDEVRTMADNHSKDESYEIFRRQAVQFVENFYMKHFKDSNFDALIPYMAMTYVDRFHLNTNQIPTVVESQDRNTDLFLICCITISWKHCTEIFVLENFLKEKQLDFTVENMTEMEGHICRQLGNHMLTVMPFEFVEFFIPSLNLPPHSSSDLRPVYQLIFKSQFDIAFTEFRPSVIAASALQCVTLEVFTTQDMIYRCTHKLLPFCSRDSAPVDKDALVGASSSAAGEIQPQQERSDYTDLEMGLNEASVVMNSELGWIEAQAEADLVWNVLAVRDKFSVLLDKEVATEADSRCNTSYMAFRGFALGFIDAYYKPLQFGFKFDAWIPYAAMNFMDHFCLDHRIPSVHQENNVTLFLTSVLFLLWIRKLNETQLRKLSNFKDVMGLNYATTENVGKMMDAILLIIKDKVQPLFPVMPFEFIDFFAPCLNLPPQSSLLRPVYKLISQSQCDIAFTQFKPSIIAASAMIVFTSKVFPCQEAAFRKSVIQLLKPVKGMIPKCTVMLEPLYKGPVTDRPAPGRASSSLLGPLLDMITRSSSLFRGQGHQTVMPSPEAPVPLIKDDEKAADNDLMNFEVEWINALANNIHRP